MKESFHNVRASTQEKRSNKKDYGREKIRLIYRDNDIAVIEKPSGMLCVEYPGSHARTAVEVLSEMLSKNGRKQEVFVVHRLDRDTSGVMMFALNENAQKKIMKEWHSMVTERIYRAVSENPPHKRIEDEGLISSPLAFNSHTMGYVPKEGEKVKTVPARTHFRVIERGVTHTLFELSLDTGKKNQIRAHLASRGYTLAGDENYRAKTDPFHRLSLHARTLCFIHPTTKKELRFEVAEPSEWRDFVRTNRTKCEEPAWKKDVKNKKSGVILLDKTLTKKQICKMSFMDRMKYLHGK